jgi:hypothetical protein
MAEALRGWLQNGPDTLYVFSALGATAGNAFTAKLETSGEYIVGREFRQR